MRRWDEERRLKKYREKIKKAKAAINSHIPLPSIRGSAPSIQIQSGFSSEPLVQFLRQFHLQQYQRKLSEEGYLHSPSLLASLSPYETASLADRLKLLPGHHQKLIEMIAELRRGATSPLVQKGGSRAIGKSLSPSVFTPKRTRNSLEIDPKASKLIDTNVPKSTNSELYAELVEAKLKISQLEGQLGAKTPKKPQKPPLVPLHKPLLSAKVSELSRSFDTDRMKETVQNGDLDQMCKGLAKALRETISIRDRYQGHREELQEIFGEEAEGIPEERDVYNFTKNAFIRMKSSQETVLVTYVYLERFSEVMEIRISEKIWKKVLLAAIIVACQVMDDSIQLSTFSQSFSLYSLSTLQGIHSSFLSFLQRNLSISATQLARSYFRLRAFALSPHAPLHSLAKNAFVEIERKAKRLESKMKEIVE